MNTFGGSKLTSIRGMGMIQRLLAAVVVTFWVGAPAWGAESAPVDAAAVFGARPDVSDMSMSPDGKNVVYIAPTTGQGTAVRILPLVEGASPRTAMVSDGNPERIQGCDWVANDRLLCRIYWVATALGMPMAGRNLLPLSRIFATNIDGSHFQLISKGQSHGAQGVDLGGGEVLDLLPEEDGKILIARYYVPTVQTGTAATGEVQGLGVDRIDTRTGESTLVLRPAARTGSYLTDGNGTVRIMQQWALGISHIEDSEESFLYRPANETQWKKLSTYNPTDFSGFLPVAVDGKQNVAYGLKDQNGHRALFTRSLDGGNTDKLVFASEDVDIGGVYQIGRHDRVVGVEYVTDFRQVEYTDPDIKKLIAALRQAVGASADMRIIDSNLDESRYLLYSTTDQNAGLYYVFDRKTHHLDSIIAARDKLDGVTLAAVKPIRYTAKDGTQIPGYLTLPPGTTSAKGLPALVMPHGGPSARDVWGFDWLAQYFAHQGYAVLQPNYRGSWGYGEKWFAQNGFQSWEVAIGDVLDAGRWLVDQGIADPNKLGIFGWSYGGYAALQSLVVDQHVFKAAVAVAPVTDLLGMVQDSQGWSNYLATRKFIGIGAHAHEGSPAEHADKIKVPVLLFHGTMDVNVDIEQSQRMDKALTAAGVKHEFVTFPGLDHRLEDSARRAQLLRQSDAFFKAAFGP